MFKLQDVNYSVCVFLNKNKEATLESNLRSKQYSKTSCTISQYLNPSTYINLHISGYSCVDNLGKFPGSASRIVLP